MKKLMTILVVFALCGVAMAAGGSSTGPNLATGHYKYEKGIYTLVGNNDYTNNLTMNYTSKADHVGKAYFTTMSASALDAYNSKNDTDYNKVVVQFLGTEIDDSRHSMGNATENIKDSIIDYGIYLYDKNARGNGIGEMYSIKDGNSFSLDPGTDFGIYYKTNSREWYSTVNYVGTWDPDQHYINYYDENGNKILKDGVGVKDKDGNVYSDIVDIRYTCAFMTTKFGDHWEFMLQTTLDNPHYNVDPDEFGGNGEIEDIPATSGQPLPGTLATLLIGSLCASALRKKNQK